MHGNRGRWPIRGAIEQDFLRRVWIEALAEMLGETKSRWEDAFRTVKSEAAAAVAELRASLGEVRVSMERMIEDRLGGLRKLVNEKNGPRIRPYEEGQALRGRVGHTPG